jgi:tetratricopeptide (TPR) repeat protein
MRLPLVASLSIFATLASPLRAQQPGPINLVMVNGDGRLVVPSSASWVPTSYQLLDGGYRTTLVFEDHRNDLTLEASIYPNDDGTPEACRDMIVPALLKDLATHTAITHQAYGSRKAANGDILATVSFLVSATGLSHMNQQNVFAFAAGPHTCAELHITQSEYVPASAPLFNAELDHMRFEAAYTPTAQDYSTLGGFFYDTTRSYRAAAAFYRRALDTLPATQPLTPGTRNLRRSLTDQLSMSYAIYGDDKSSYDVNEQAITLDPTYAFYYYNLACVDAEMHNPIDARRHLEEAFSRRTNVLPGEQLPDPVHDTSLQKIAYDKQFWKFVESLSRTLPY